jgi:hypothetical protein
MPKASRDNQPARAQLKRITDILLFGQADPGRIREVVVEFHDLLTEISGLDDSSTNQEDTDEIVLASGKAISPKDAARSVLDYYRTAQFLRGAQAAIHEAQKQWPDRRLEILYAGCGPFAPFALMLATRFTADEIQFTLIDIHARSIACAKHIFELMGLGKHVREYFLGDAVSYRKPSGSELHVVIVEAMQKALSKEPQVAITMNLAPQLSGDGFFVPEKITIDAWLADLNQEISHTAPARVNGAVDGGPLQTERVYLGRIFELSAATIREGLAGGAAHETPSVRPVIVEVPKDAREGLDAMLTTAVTVFDSILLGDYDSGITYPTILHDLGALNPGARIEFCYATDNAPGFKYRLL